MIWSLRTFILVISMMLSPAAHSAAPPPADEVAEQKIIIDAVKGAIDRKDYKALNAMENEFRQTRSRTGSGIWKLSVFHWRVLAKLGPQEGRCDDHTTDFFRSWIAATPAEPAPYISRAAVLEGYAWCFRGSGYAHSVSDQAMETFAAKVDEARQILSKHRSTASIDPHYYVVMERIYIDQGVGKAEFKRLLDEATSREPDYHYLYFSAFRYFQPQWYGSDAEVDEMARYAAARTTGAEGLGMYARFYWFALDCNCPIRKSIDWPTMKRAMGEVMARYPSDWNAINFARMSCHMLDPEEAASWFARVKGDYRKTWSNKDEMHRCESIAQLATNSAVAKN